MPFLITSDGKGNVKVTDLDKHKKTPCGLCVSSAFRLGFFLHDDCGEAIGRLTKEERDKIHKLLDERDRKRVERLSPEEKAKICKTCGHFTSQHHPLGVADWGTGCAIKLWSKDRKGKPELIDCPCKGFVSLVGDGNDEQ